MKAPVTIPLTQPVVAFGRRHDALTLRTPKRRDIQAHAPNTRPGDSAKSIALAVSEAGLNLIAFMARVPVAVVVNLCDEDIERVGEAVHSILDQVL